jgi:glycosyltransferase involved in cell wall biosynthesis
MMPGVETGPLVSAVVTLYNQGHFARATIESVLAQDYRPMEVIVVDDGSTDDTPEVCAAFGARITYVRQPNAGAGAARNAGMRRARGTLLAFLDGDDLWEKRKIGAQVGAARGHPDAGVIVVDGAKFEDTVVLAPTLYYGTVGRHFAKHGGTEMVTHCHELLLRRCLVHSPSQMLIPSEVFARVGPWNARIRVASDYELLLRVAGAGYSFVFLAAPLMRYRVVANGLSGPSALREFTWGLDEYEVFRTHAGLVDRRQRALIAERLGEMTRSLARRAYHHGERCDRKWSRRYLWRLALRSRRADLVVPYLLAALLPSRVADGVSRLLGRLICGGASTRDVSGDR